MRGFRDFEITIPESRDPGTKKIAIPSVSESIREQLHYVPDGTGVPKLPHSLLKIKKICAP